jgi:hypothetical protein
MKHPVFFLSACVVSLLTLSDKLMAHGDFMYMPQTTLSSRLYLSAQNKGPGDDVTWQIPGVLMGGNAHGSERGANVDDATLRFVWANMDGFFVDIEAGGHGHGGEVEADLEQAFTGYHWTHTSGHIKLETGKMKAAFSYANTMHPSQRPFTDASLPYQAWLGDHFADLGARAQFMNWHGANGLSSYGVEIWRGHTFPGNKSANDIAWDVFARYQHTHGDMQYTAGVWHLASNSEQRRDSRLADGHNHGANAISEELRFSGPIRLSGLEAQAIWQQSPVLSHRANIDFIWYEADGELRDDVRRADLDTTQKGLALTVSSEYLEHQWALRYEVMRADNTLHGPGSSLLARDAGFENAGNPSRTSASYSYELMKGLFARIELIRDSSTTDSIDYARIALSWSGELYTR